MRILLLSLAAVVAFAADNPLARDSAAVAAGRAAFLQRCAVCHGQDALGGQAANLVRAPKVVRGSDDALFKVIREGLPGTIMPPQTDLSDEGVWQLVSYLHGLARPGEQPPVEGDVDAGRRLFSEKGCIGCHIVEGKGGFLGPALGSIATRMRTEQIRTEILEPDAVVGEGYRRVTVRTTDGRRIEGLLKNEDTVSLQVLTINGSFALLSRAEIESVEKLEGSPMPAPQGLTPEELTNLLAFLDRQRDPLVSISRGFDNY